MPRAQVVAALIAAGAPLEAENRDGWTPLISAARAGSLKSLQALVAAGAKLEHREKSVRLCCGRVALHGCAPACGACLSLRIEAALFVCSQLRQRRSDPETGVLVCVVCFAAAQFGDTALLMAAYTEEADAVQLLVELGADVKAQTYVRATVISVVSLLLRLRLISVLGCWCRVAGVRRKARTMRA